MRDRLRRGGPEIDIHTHTLHTVVVGIEDQERRTSHVNLCK